MATEAVELATGYISLVPSMQGSESSIAGLLIPAAESAGDQAGAGAGKKFGGAWSKALLAAGVGAAVAGAFKGLYEIGDTFDELTDTIRVGTGAQGDALDGLVAIATNVGKTVPAEFSAIGPVVSDLNTRLGLSGDTLQTVATQYLEAGRMLGEEVDVTKTSAAFSAFKIEGDGVVTAMDTLFQVSQATGVGMNTLADSVQANAPAMQNLGFSFEETAALAGSLDKAGLNSTAMMSAMGKGLINLAKDGEEPQAAFARVTDEIQGFVDKGDTAAALDLASQVFGTKGANQFVGALQDGTIALDDLVASAGLSGDTIIGVGEETQDFAEKWQIVKNNAQAALEPLATTVFTALGDALTGAMPYLESFGAWLGENQWVLGVVAGVIGVTLVAAFFAWTASIWASTAALLANPMTWIVIGIIALIAALVLLIANWDSVVAFLKDVWSGIVDWLSGVWDSITNALTTAWNSVSEFFTGLWESITTGLESAWNGVATFFTGLWTSISTGFTTAWNAVGTFLSDTWTKITDKVKSGWNAIIDWIKGIPGRFLENLRAIGNIASDMWGWVIGMKDKAVEGFTTLVDWVKLLPAKILAALGSVGTLLLDAGKNILKGFLDGLKAGFDGVKDFVGGIGGWIADHKGPKAYDLALLVPAGGWIMDGLQSGIEAEIPSLRNTLDRVSNEIKVGAEISATSVANGASVSSLGDARSSQGSVQYVTVNYPIAEPQSTAINRASQYAGNLGE